MTQYRRGTIFWRGAWLALLGAGLVDRLCKSFAQSAYFDAQHIGWRYFAFERFHNTGVAFSIPLPQWFVLPLTFIFLVVLLVWARRTRSNTTIFGAALVAVGALSNAVDRIAYGYTIDYIRVLDSILNLADVWVVVGICMLLFIKKRQQ